MSGEKLSIKDLFKIAVGKKSSCCTDEVEKKSCCDSKDSCCGNNTRQDNCCDK